MLNFNNIHICLIQLWSLHIIRRKNLLLLLWILKLIIDMVNDSTPLNRIFKCAKETYNTLNNNFLTVLQMFVLCSLKTLSLC